MPIDVRSFLEHYKTQNGVFATRKLKGFRESDISMFLHMQSSLCKERIELEKFLDSLKDSFSPREIERMHTTGYSTINWLVFPFKFMYKSAINLIIKKERVEEGNRKLNTPMSPVESMAMSAYCPPMAV
jgi:hypothetical protein